MQKKNSPEPKHFEIKQINWVPNKEKAKDFNLIFSGKNRELENIIAGIVNEEVSCDKFIKTFLPAEFIGSKINLKKEPYTPHKTQKTDLTYLLGS